MPLNETIETYELFLAMRGKNLLPLFLSKYPPMIRVFLKRIGILLKSVIYPYPF